MCLILPTPHGMNVFGCVCPSGAFPWGSPSLGLFSPSHLQKVSNPKNGAVHLPAPAHRHVETVYMSDPCCVGLPNGPFQLNATAVTTFDCLKNTLPTTHCGVLKVITMMLFCHHAFGDNTLQDWKNERPRKTSRGKKVASWSWEDPAAAARVNSSVKTIHGCFDLSLLQSQVLL